MVLAQFNHYSVLNLEHLGFEECISFTQKLKQAHAEDLHGFLGRFELQDEDPAYWHTQIRRRGDRVILVRDENTFNTVAFQVWHEPRGDYGMLMTAWVAKEHRGKGLGKLVKSVSMAEMVKNGFSFAEGTVHNENRTQIDLLTRHFGFTAQQRGKTYTTYIASFKKVKHQGCGGRGQ